MGMLPLEVEAADDEAGAGGGSFPTAGAGLRYRHAASSSFVARHGDGADAFPLPPQPPQAPLSSSSSLHPPMGSPLRPSRAPDGAPSPSPMRRVGGGGGFSGGGGGFSGGGGVPTSPAARALNARLRRVKAMAWCALATAALLVGRALLGHAAPHLPPHLTGHPVHYYPDLLTPVTQATLMELAREVGTFETVTAAEAGYSMLHEHIGEAFDHPPVPDPADPTGTRTLCSSHPLLVKSANGSACVLAGRADVGRHYIATGGLEGLREQPSDLLSRAQSFTRYMFNPMELPATTALFNDGTFQGSARSVCPPHAQTLDPFQAGIIVQVPGQTVPTHVDGVWFHGANRFTVPQWLLATMQFSGLFQDRLIHQVQLVAYFGPTPSPSPSPTEVEEQQRAAGGGARPPPPPPRKRDGGDFVFWTGGPDDPEHVSSAPGSGNAVDGSKLVHAAAVFEPSQPPPALDKGRRNALVHQPDTDTWALYTDGSPRGVAWHASQLRFSVVYRARCFASADARDAFRAGLEAGEGVLRLEEDILAPLVAEAARRGAGGGSARALWALPRLELALALMGTFVRYPLPGTLVPFNYCAAGALLPGWRAVGWVVGVLCPRVAVP